MKNLVKKYPFIYKIALKLRGLFRKYYGGFKIRYLVWIGFRRIVVGTFGSYEKGWIPTDYENLDLTNPNDFSIYFQKASLEAIVAEHVFGHLTLDEAVVAAKNCGEYLSSSGYLRIAVPDGYHPNEEYINNVKVGGWGPHASDHKVLYTHDLLSNVLEQAGFSVVKLEYFDKQGKFHFKEWDPKKGYIKRSKRFDPRNRDGILNYTSIIIDAIHE